VIRSKIDQQVDQMLDGRSLREVVAAIAHVGDDEAVALIERGAVWLHPHRAQQPDAAVAAGSRLVVHFPPSGCYDRVLLTAADIVWEDKVLLALNKQPGSYANLTPWDIHGTLPTALAAYLRDREGRDLPIHFAHQLDRDTSGLLLVSKQPRINGALQQMFLSGAIEKTYLALATGAIDDDVFEVRTGHGRGKHGLFRVYPIDDVGKPLPLGTGRVRLMHTRFEVVARNGGATLLHAHPLTGRTHQIRLHLQHVGHPIVGDERYGGALHIGALPIPHHLLHAARLVFPHPVTKLRTDLHAPPPPIWTSVLDRLGFPI
jgi:23S rRNA pseudouridine1911/1915/1917 synthase